MPGIAIANLRVGHRYFLINLGDRYEFQVIKNLNGKDFQLKDLISLEVYKISDLTRFGIGKDFEIREWDSSRL